VRAWSWVRRRCSPGAAAGGGGLVDAWHPQCKPRLRLCMEVEHWVAQTGGTDRRHRQAAHARSCVAARQRRASHAPPLQRHRPCGRETRHAQPRLHQGVCGVRRPQAPGARHGEPHPLAPLSSARSHLGQA
jgi:hypothetical protein